MRYSVQRARGAPAEALTGDAGPISRRGDQFISPVQGLGGSP